MIDIRLDRTFWPVGHGAFYTERFYDHKDGRIFTAIYDCGSGRRWGRTLNGSNDASPKVVRQMIEDFIPTQKDPNGNIVKDIDVAFVSHLHVDHINGLPSLLPRIKKMVLPHLSKCRLLEAFLYNAIPEEVRTGELSVEAIEDERQVDVESEVQTFVLRLARGEVESTVQVVPNNERPAELIELERLDRDITNGSEIRVPLSPAYNAFWIYKPVDVDACSDDKRKDIIAALQAYVTDGKIVNANDDIDWNKVQKAVLKAGLKAIIAIYEQVFGIKVSSQHNNYSMPVYSGPAESTVDARVRIHLRSYVHRPLWHAMLCEFDIFSHPFYPGPMLLGQRCKLMSCLYMGDFNASDDKKYGQLRRILGMYYDRVGIQQVPHHFSGENRRAELYRGPLFAFGNISGYNDRSFKCEVIEEDIARFGCNPLVITKDFRTMVKFEYEITIF